MLADALKAQPTRLVAWIDEAHRVPVDTLVDIRSLAEFEHDPPQILSIVFSGPSDLQTIIDVGELFPLKRRISVRCILQGLRRDELEVFLNHRFGTTEAKRVTLSLYDDLFERARATPALLDRVVRHALNSAKGMITEDHLREAFDVAGI
jgi:type II secretory pathway predicted ATPase ExeA